MKYIKGFDSLRAISILMVMISHLLPAGYAFYETRLWIVVSGDTGVRIFFTLSGFLITSLLLKEKERNGKISFKNFFARRFIRLLPPLLLFYVAIAVFMSSGDIQVTWVGFAYSLFYAYNFVPHIHYTVELGHTWSLGVEEQFYVIWPFLINAIKRTSVFSIVTLVFLGLCSVAYLTFPDLELTKHYHTNRWFFPAAAPIFVGSYFAILNQKKKENWEIFFKNKPLITLIALALFIYPIYSLENLLSLSPIVQSVGVALFLIWILYNQEGKFVRLLNNRPMQYIGKISYGIYVYQGFFLRTGPGGELAVQHYPLNIFLVFIIAILSYEFYEKKVLKLKQKFI